MIRFEFLDKCCFPLYSCRLFDILADNMSKIAPTGNSYEEDYASWLHAVSEGLEKEPRKIILIYSGEDIVGYFQYYANNELFMMEEIQILPEWHGKEQIFRKLYGFVLPLLPSDTKIVEAYANKQNAKSQAILGRLGLSVIGENKNGNSWHYRGDLPRLLQWFNTTG